MVEANAEYLLLRNAIRETKDVNGLTCEIGTRLGGGTVAICDEILKMDKKRPHISVDPYGNIDYIAFDNRVAKSNYTNQMKNQGMKALYEWMYEHNYNMIFINLEDTEFFNRYADGVPVYENYKSLINKYSVVFLDGPHSADAVLKEIEFFAVRMDKGAMLICDDTDYYAHYQRVHPRLLELGFIEFERNKRQISYKKNIQVEYK